MADNGPIFEDDDEKEEEKGDIGKLIEELQKLEEELQNLEIVNNLLINPKVKKDSKVEDLVKPASISFLVPTGFVMMHNDLQEIIKILKKDDGGSSKGGGGVASAITAVSTTVSAVADVIGMIKSPAGLGDILNNDEVNEQLATDPGVYKIRLDGTKMYLKAYYNSLLEQFGYVVDFNTGEITKAVTASQVGKEIGNVLGGIVGGVIEGAGRALTNVLVDAALNGDEEIKEVRKTGYKTYLKAYYNSMVEQFGYVIDFSTGEITKQTTASQVGKEIGNVLGGIVGGFVEKAGSSLTNVAVDATLNGDEEIKEIRKAGYKTYLKAYYNSMVEQFGYVIDFNTGEITKQVTSSEVGKEIGNFIGGIVGGVVEKSGSSLTNVIVDATLNKDADILRVRKLGYLNYLKVYYNSLLSEYGIEIDFDKGTTSVKDKSWWDKIKTGASNLGKSIGNLVSGITGSVGNSLTNIVADTSLENDPDIISAKRLGLSSYITAYFDALKESLLNRKNDLFSKRNVQDMGNKFTDVFEGYLDNLSGTINVDISKSFNDVSWRDSNRIIENMSSLNSTLLWIDNKMASLNKINESISEKIDELKQIIPSYEMPSDNDSSSAVNESDMVSTGN